MEMSGKRLRASTMANGGLMLGKVLSWMDRSRANMQWLLMWRRMGGGGWCEWPDGSVGLMSMENTMVRWRAAFKVDLEGGPICGVVDEFRLSEEEWPRVAANRDERGRVAMVLGWVHCRFCVQNGGGQEAGGEDRLPSPSRAASTFAPRIPRSRGAIHDAALVGVVRIMGEPDL